MNLQIKIEDTPAEPAWVTLKEAYNQGGLFEVKHLHSDEENVELMLMGYGFILSFRPDGNVEITTDPAVHRDTPWRYRRTAKTLSIANPK